MLRRLMAAALLLLPFAACAPQVPPPYAAPSPYPRFQQPPVLPRTAPEKVGLLLPLSGSNRMLGQAMLNAAQLALFDQGDPRVELLPRDTRGTAAGAAEAARAALADGARALAGPPTLGETGAAAAPARAAGAPLFAFTNDAAQAGSGVWVLGMTPTEQADRLATAAATIGARRFGVLAPADEFGRRLVNALRRRLPELGLPEPVVVLHPIRGDVAQAAQQLASQAGPEGLDAVLLAESGAAARTAAATLAAALPSQPRFLGPAHWAQDPGLAQEPALAGAWFPGPDPSARANFESRYISAFGERPPRLAGIAYDAAALASRTVRSGGVPVGEALMGADGPIRLLPDGQAQRGLAIFALDPSGEPRLIQPAPVPGA
ncbi:MAG: penicillin-binding protein activator [Acetobacteraceae bacterium]|nr:penicillin-binding protein activator [Acetobacteraceae bacterium]